MSKKPTDGEMTVADLMEFATENIPEDWEIRVVMSLGSLGVQLVRPMDRMGNRTIVDAEFKSLEISGMVLEAVNLARDLDGLGWVCLDGTPHEYGLDD